MVDSIPAGPGGPSSRSFFDEDSRSLHSRIATLTAMTRSPVAKGIRYAVVASEDSPAAERVFATAGLLAGRLGAKLVPARIPVREHQWAPAHPRGPGPSTGSLQGIPLLEGIPAIELVRFAESARAELLIAGAATEGELTLACFKELADAVVRRAEVPCLILPAGQDSLNRMVVALDGSERGMRALRIAWSLRQMVEGEVSAVYVEPGGTDRNGIQGPPGAVAERIGARVTETVGPGAGIPVRHHRGDVVTSVLGELSREAGDLLVVGVRRGGPAAVSQSTGNGRRLLAAASCAVLTVPL